MHLATQQLAVATHGITGGMTKLHGRGLELIPRTPARDVHGAGQRHLGPCFATHLVVAGIAKRHLRLGGMKPDLATLTDNGVVLGIQLQCLA